MKEYSVYIHTFPNGKKYVGISNNPAKRWGFGGANYIGNKKMTDAIIEYGWDNVQHDIVASGLSFFEASEKEKELIQQHNTIYGGYNEAIGGLGSVARNYLNPYLLSMIRAAKKWFETPEGYTQTWDRVYAIRKSKEEADFWNEACEAVLKKHGKMSKENDFDVARFWHHMHQVELLDQMVNRGEDISTWKEQSYPEAIEEALYGPRRNNSRHILG